MRQSVLSLAVVLFTLTLLSCAQETAPGADETVSTETDVAVFEAAVFDILETFCATIVAGDVDGWIALWDENGINMPPKTAALHGKPAIRGVFAETHLSVNFKEFTFDNEEVQAFGDFGFARGRYFVTVMAEGKIVLGEGKYLTIFRRQPDGSWKIYRDCFNSSPPPSPPALKEG